MGLAFGPSTTIEADPEVVSCALGEGTALLDMRTGTYFSVNRVGSFVWERLSRPASVAEILAAIGERFDVQPGVCAADLDALLSELAAANLIKISDASGA